MGGCRKRLVKLGWIVVLACLGLVILSILIETDSDEDTAAPTEVALDPTPTLATDDGAESAETADTPSVTPSPTITNTPLPSLTPTITNTPEPVLADESMITMLVDLVMLQHGHSTDSRFEDQSFVIDVQSANTDVETRFEVIGLLSGAVTQAYAENDDWILTASEPVTIVVNFRTGTVVLVRVMIPYTAATDFINGRITTTQFMNTWTAE
jgi:hypothetical protein